MSSNKIFGYILILAGLAIIIFTLYQSYQIFTGGTPTPQLFVPTANKSSKSSNMLDQAQQAIQSQLENILPSSSIFELLNLISWSMLAAILILGGGKIASIGIKLASIRESIPTDTAAQ